MSGGLVNVARGVMGAGGEGSRSTVVAPEQVGTGGRTAEHPPFRQGLPARSPDRIPRAPMLTDEFALNASRKQVLSVSLAGSIPDTTITTAGGGRAPPSSLAVLDEDLVLDSGALDDRIELGWQLLDEEITQCLFDNGIFYRVRCYVEGDSVGNSVRDTVYLHCPRGEGDRKTVHQHQKRRAKTEADGGSSNSDVDGPEARVTTTRKSLYPENSLRFLVPHSIYRPLYRFYLQKHRVRFPRVEEEQAGLLMGGSTLALPGSPYPSAYAGGTAVRGLVSSLDSSEQSGNGPTSPTGMRILPDDPSSLDEDPLKNYIVAVDEDEATLWQPPCWTLPFTCLFAPCFLGKNVHLKLSEISHNATTLYPGEIFDLELSCTIANLQPPREDLEYVPLSEPDFETLLQEHTFWQVLRETRRFLHKTFFECRKRYKEVRRSKYHVKRVQLRLNQEYRRRAAKHSSDLCLSGYADAESWVERGFCDERVDRQVIETLDVGDIAEGETGKVFFSCPVLTYLSPSTPDSPVGRR